MGTEGHVRLESDDAQRYYQIGKEALATTGSLERFTGCLHGMYFHVETNHEPLVSLLSSKKNLNRLSPRIQHFRACLMRYMYTIAHLPEKSLLTADALSRAPRGPLPEAEVILTDEVTAQANLVVGALPATEKRLTEIRARQLENDVCRHVMRYCAEGWPSHPTFPSILRPYWQVQYDLIIQNGLLLKGVRLVIPTCMRLAMLDKLHEGHQVVVRFVPWLSLPSGGPDSVGNWRSWCAVHGMRCRTTQPTEQIIATETDLRPWQKFCTEMFIIQEGHLLASGRLRQQLRRTSQVSRNDIIRCDSVPEIYIRKTWYSRDFVADNGPQYPSEEPARFANVQGFLHCISSPRYPQSNGKAERAVQTVKTMLKKSVDPYGALLAYQTKTLECGYSPAQLLMSRQLRTSIPVMASTLQPRLDESKQLRNRQNI